MTSTTQGFEQMGWMIQEELARTTQRTAFAAYNYTVRTQEVNIRSAQGLIQAWIDGLRLQTELSEEMRNLFETADEQADAFQRFLGQWGFPFAGTPLDPFSFWREGMRLMGTTTREATGNGG